MGIFLYGFAFGLVISLISMVVGWYCSAIAEAPDEMD